jgi:hypothetical protein
VLKNFPAPLAGKKSCPYVAAKRSSGRGKQANSKLFRLPLRFHASVMFSIS